MVCPHCKGAERVFSNSWAQGELDEYYKNGSSKTTKLLIDVLKENEIEGMSLLDIGGGVGAVQHSLMTAGVRNVVDVDASAAYLQVAQAEAEKLGYAENASYVHGDFVQLAPEIESADIVTLDRVVCCYPHMHELIELSAQRAKQFYALVYPRDNIITKLGFQIFNFFAFKISRSPFRTYVHPTREIDAIIQSNGLNRVFHKKVSYWQVFVYKR